LSRAEIRGLYFGLFATSIIPLILIYLGYASRFIGILLIAIFLYYNFKLFRGDKSQKIHSENRNRKILIKTISTIFLSAVGVVASAFFIIESASYIAINIGVSSVVIGATIIAFGTSLPELVTSIDATKKGHIEIALGNIIGSGFINTTLILGVALIGSELRVNMTAFSNLVVFSIITNLLLWYFLSGEEISRRESSVFLFMYFLFLAVNFGVLTF
jgi:cation:H+ antiporter